MTLTTPTEERCTWSDLYISQCAHCRGLTLDLPTPRSITAQHPGLCATCEVPFAVGDHIVARHGNYQCTTCALS